MTKNFICEIGPITVEYLPRPTWLIRKRVGGNSLTSSYAWVANLTYSTLKKCEMKGYLARGKGMTQEDYVALQQIGGFLNFDEISYSRYSAAGQFRKKQTVPTLRSGSTGQCRPLNCGEKEMGTKTYRVTAELIDDNTKQVKDTLIHATSGRTNKEIRVLQNLLKTGYQEPLEAIGDQLAEAES